MTIAAAQMPEFKRSSGGGRLVVTWMVLLAFALQSYITQTHIHDATAPARSAIPAGVSQATVAATSPADQEAIACPFCQAVAAAGAFFAAPPVVPAPPLAQARTVASAPVAIGLFLPSAGFSWRSRAPPQS
ncbi:MAG TPA: hypothetical protein VG166_14630 [Caulobacteraceae bacterium]|jgi:hypothetical protein|nr:hypothetical protein [Caulobacteraceae bacterium]